MSFVETPRPSVAEMFAAMPLVSGRLRLVQDEILRRLRLEMPAMVAELNERNGWTDIPSREIPLPSGFEIAPAILDDGYVGKILVGVSLKSSAFGVGAFKNEVSVTVFSVDEAIRTGQQVTVCWERAELIRAVLFPFLTGCVNAEGKRCWNQLQPTTISMLPDDWGDEFSGTQCSFIATQAPGHNESWS